MAKARTTYVCTSCGYTSAKPLGRCPNCQAWNSFEEEVPAVTTAAARGGAYGGITGGRLTPLSGVGRREEPRTPSGIPELDRVLGILSLYRTENDEAGVPVEEIERLISDRQAARRRRDFAAADRIRIELSDRGVLLEDSAAGTRWKRK